MRDVTSILKVVAQEATKGPTPRRGPHMEFCSSESQEFRLLQLVNSYNQNLMLQVRE